MSGIQRKIKDKTRCPWVGTDKPVYELYHDTEWGVPVREDDRTHFEFLILEGAQAGLSWETILNKREAYRLAFEGFDILLRGDFGMSSRLERVVFGRKSKGVPPHWMEHFMSRHAFVASNNIGLRVRKNMANMQRTRNCWRRSID